MLKKTYPKKKIFLSKQRETTRTENSHDEALKLPLPFDCLRLILRRRIGNLTKGCLSHNTQHFKQNLRRSDDTSQQHRHIPNLCRKESNTIRTSAAAIVVSSAFVSYAGATSTISAEMIFKPSSPRRMVRNSRVDQPPVSGVPVAGAKAGSIESICRPINLIAD